jgi:hypothetical protein
MANSKQLSINSNTSCNRMLRYKIHLVNNFNKTKSAKILCKKSNKKNIYFFHIKISGSRLRNFSNLQNLECWTVQKYVCALLNSDKGKASCCLELVKLCWYYVTACTCEAWSEESGALPIAKQNDHATLRYVSVKLKQCNAFQHTQKGAPFQKNVRALTTSTRNKEI